VIVVPVTTSPDAPPSSLTAAGARALFRSGTVSPSAGWADGYTQANLLIVPASLAYDVLLFAQRNPKACPVLDVLDAGRTEGALLAGGDIRTDVARYVVYRDGVPVDRPADLHGVWREDLSPVPARPTDHPGTIMANGRRRLVVTATSLDCRSSHARRLRRPTMSHAHPILENDRMSQWLGVVVERADFGAARIRMDIREEMVNGFGIAHGGVIFAFADTCFALACNDPAGDSSTITVAAGADIIFVASAYRGQTLTAVGTVRSRFGQSGIYDVRVTAGDTLVAEFRGRSRTITTPGAE